ncbi:hypothetical protein D1007_25857 [Hordeum vulgare]|nr:hypothetical protein D1007_25857 [Hordeum vulgare]
MSSSAPKKGQYRGAWVGTDICDGNIDVLRDCRMLPLATLVAARVPGAEAAPTLEKGEVVVFEEHFYRGFGLPASDFFARFLTFFGLQPHHLAPNAILQLVAFVVLCEGFLGIEPHLDIWRKLFYFKKQSVMIDKADAAKLTGPKPMTPCDAALVNHRTTSGFPHMPLQDSIKMWHKGFFYVKNVDPSQECINLPPFTIAPPTARLNWKATLPKPIVEVEQICAHLNNMKIHGLLGRDMLATMVSRRVLPLQQRPHLICHMGGRHDPSRLSTKNFRAGAVARNVNLISSTNMDEELDADSALQMFKRLQKLQPPASDVEASDPSEIEDEGGDGAAGLCLRRYGRGDGVGGLRTAWDAEEVEEETAAAIERAAWAAADDAKKALDEESTLRWEKAARKIQVAEGRTVDFQSRLDATVLEQDALREADKQLHLQLDLLQTEKKDREATHQAELEQLRAALQEKDSSHTADMERLKTAHLDEMERNVAALKENEAALTQVQAEVVKETEVAQNLQGELTLVAKESMTREHEAVEEDRETDIHFNLEAAVETSHEERRAAGEEVDADAGWSMEEIDTGAKARLHELVRSLERL